MDPRAALRYARALFAAAKKQDILDAVAADLIGILGVLEHDPKLRSFLKNPVINGPEKVKLLERVFSDRVTALTMHCIRLLLDKRREAEFELVAQNYLGLLREHQNIELAHITSARPLSEAQSKALVQKLESSVGKKVEASFAVDPSLMGGIKVGLGTYLLDGTLRGGLGRLREKLIYDVLKQN